MFSMFSPKLMLITAFALGALDAPRLGAQDDSTKPGPYDFIPGERILYSEDFQPTASGVSALRRLTDATSRMTIDPRGGRPFLHTKPPASFVALMKEKLPERFTIDFDMYVPDAQILRLSTVGDGATPGTIDIGPHSVAVTNGSNQSVNEEIDRMIPDFDHAKTMHYSITVDGRDVRLYVERVRVLNAPNAAFGRSDKVKFYFNGGDDPGLIERNPPMWITDIRIAAGNALGYDELVAKGRIATHGILFDTGSDRIRPESAPTLKLIGDMLASHADLKLTIEGHTDNIGVPSSNQLLSERRAAAVKQYLVAALGVNASRLGSAGFGDTKPTAPNSTAAGRQQNRRVELVKQ